MYDANKQSKNGIVVSYKHIVPENKIIKIGIRKNKVNQIFIGKE